MKYKNAIIGLIFMSVAVIIFNQYYFEMGDAYGTTFDSDFGDTYSKLSEMTNITDRQQLAVRTGSVEDVSLLLSTTNGVLRTIDFMLDIPSLLKTMLDDLIRSFGFPQIVADGINIAFISMIVLIIVVLIMKVKPEI